jgi:hypothetical protein
VVTHHNYNSVGWRKRERLDALMQDLLRLAGLARAGDYQALRRHRRMLRARRPGLFPGLHAPQQ